MMDLLRLNIEMQPLFKKPKIKGFQASDELCPLQLTKSQLKGKIQIDLYKSPPTWTQLEVENANNSLGGRHFPAVNCQPRNKVAILIPYRNRDRELRVLLHHLHPILQRQQLSYGIFVIEQAGDNYFNRGMMFNIGYTVAMNLTKNYWQCFIFHDVDLLPEDDRNLYSCPNNPRHMSVAIDKFKYRLPYKDIFGGVSAMSGQNFVKVNGFSNRFWGWGGEDDDIRRRINKAGLQLTRYSPLVARYTMIKHKQARPNPKRNKILRENAKFYGKDGLNNLRFKDLQIREHRSHTRIKVSVRQTEK